jgi:N-acetylglutamate synthase-like GNAT family acetyltransferase
MRESYLAFVVEKYSHLANFEYFFDDLKASLACVPSQQRRFFIAVERSGDIVAHICLMIDTRLPPTDAFWGFFECEDSFATFDFLWRSLLDLARENGISNLKGPINGSIWNQYRFVRESDGSPFFKGEMLCEPYYHGFLASTDPVEIAYHSAYRKKFDSIIAITAPFHEESIGSGFSIELSKGIRSSDLQSAFALSRSAFGDNWGYVGISEHEFHAIYRAGKIASSSGGLYFLKKDHKAIGYCLLLSGGPKVLIFKTIALLPEFRGLGLANALIYAAHLDALKNGIDKVIYALIRDDNAVKRLPQDDAVIFRRYAAFENKASRSFLRPS